MILLVTVLGLSSAYSAKTTVIDFTEKADKASEILMAKTKNVDAEELVLASEAFVSPKEYESMLKDVKKVKGLSIDSIMHGEDFFYLQTGPIKIVFKWIDKEDVAYKINGHSFSYEEAANTELWQKKIFEIVKSYQTPRAGFKKNIKAPSDAISANAFAPKISMLILPFLFQLTPAHAFLKNINWSSGWTWTAIGAVVVALVANHYYRKHKKQHAQNKQKILENLSVAEASLERARASGVSDLSPYEARVQNYRNLSAEYNHSSNDIGFFGFLFGNRITKPAMYDGLMNTPPTDTGTGGPGQPAPPPTGGTSQGAF